MALMAMVLAVSACAAPAAAPAADSGDMAADSDDEMMEEMHFRADDSVLRAGLVAAARRGLEHALPGILERRADVH